MVERTCAVHLNISPVLQATDVKPEFKGHQHTQLRFAALGCLVPSAPRAQPRAWIQTGV